MIRLKAAKPCIIRAIRDGVVLVLQSKLYNQPVGNGAVQEVFAGKSFYRAHAVAVVYTGGFTKSARAVAVRTSVHLLTPDQLRSWSPARPAITAQAS